MITGIDACRNINFYFFNCFYASLSITVATCCVGFLAMTMTRGAGNDLGKGTKEGLCLPLDLSLPMTRLTHFGFSISCTCSFTTDTKGVALDLEFFFAAKGRFFKINLDRRF